MNAPRWTVRMPLAQRPGEVHHSGGAVGQQRGQRGRGSGGGQAHPEPLEPLQDPGGLVDPLRSLGTRWPGCPRAGLAVSPGSCPCRRSTTAMGTPGRPARCDRPRRSARRAPGQSRPAIPVKNAGLSATFIWTCMVYASSKSPRLTFAMSAHMKSTCPDSPAAAVQRDCGVDVGRRDVHADDRAARGARHLPGRPTESRADVERNHRRREPEARQQSIDGLGPAAVELVDAVELRPGSGW